MGKVEHQLLAPPAAWPPCALDRRLASASVSSKAIIAILSKTKPIGRMILLPVRRFVRPMQKAKRHRRVNRDTHPASERRITRDGDAMHTPPLARIIVERAMLGAAVVPDRQRTNLPAESAGKLRLHGVRHQKIENRPRLGALEPFERLRVIAYVERFAAGLRMGAHKRMRGFRLHVAGVAHLGCHLLVAGVTAVFGRTYLVTPAEYLAVSDIAGLDALEHLFHRIG